MEGGESERGSGLAAARSERLAARRVALDQARANPPVSEPLLDEAPRGQDNFLSWVEITFLAAYSREEKGLLVEEFRERGIERGAFKLLAGYGRQALPAGRSVILPVRGCRMTSESWMSVRGTGASAVRLPLAQAPGAPRVGLVVMEGVPRWAEMAADPDEMVLAALDSALPATINWDVDWLDVEVGINSPARCLALYVESTEAAQAIRDILKPVEVEEGAFAVGGVWDAVGRPIPVLLQPAGVRDEREGEWACRACLYTLDTIFRSWCARRVVKVVIEAAAEGDATWPGLEQRLGVTLRKSGHKGEQGASLTGVLDVYSFRTPSGSLCIWLTVIGTTPADALITTLQSGRREAYADWSIRTATTEEAYREGARRWGPLYRLRHTAPTAVKVVWGRPPALAWAMAANAPPAKHPPPSQSGQRRGGATERQAGEQSLPRQSAWAQLTPPLSQTSSSERMVTGGGIPDGRLEAIAADVAGLKLGQARLTTRVDTIQAIQAEQTRSLLEMEAKLRADSAREAVLAKASHQAINQLAERVLLPGRERGRHGAGRSHRERPANGAAMETEVGTTVLGVRRSLSPERCGSLTRQRVGNGTGAGVGGGVAHGDGEQDSSSSSV